MARTRTTRIEARLSPDALGLVRRAAEIEGRSLSDFVVTAAQEAARRTIAEAQILQVSVEDQRALVKALLEPAEPNEALQRARNAHRRLISR